MSCSDMTRKLRAHFLSCVLVFVFMIGIAHTIDEFESGSGAGVEVAPCPFNETLALTHSTHSPCNAAQCNTSGFEQGLSEPCCQYIDMYCNAVPDPACTYNNITSLVSTYCSGQQQLCNATDGCTVWGCAPSDYSTCTACAPLVQDQASCEAHGDVTNDTVCAWWDGTCVGCTALVCIRCAR